MDDSKVYTLELNDPLTWNALIKWAFDLEVNGQPDKAMEIRDSVIPLVEQDAHDRINKRGRYAEA